LPAAGFAKGIALGIVSIAAGAMHSGSYDDYKVYVRTIPPEAE
jgi:hypothetical protein